MPHITKRGNIWYVYWLQNGKRHSKAISPDLAATKEWANRKLAELYARKNGLPIKDFSLDSFYEEYLRGTKKADRTRLKDGSVL
jgi:hypothetical protein